MVLLHQFLIPGLIAGQNRPHHDLTQVQARLPRRSTPQTFYVLQPGAYNTPQGVAQNKLQLLKTYRTWERKRIHPVEAGLTDHVWTLKELLT